MGSKQQQQTLNDEGRSTPPDVAEFEAIDAAVDVTSMPAVETEPTDSIGSDDGFVTAAPEPGIELFSTAALVAFIAANNRSSTDADTNQRNRALSRQLSARGPFRLLFTLPADWERELDTLEADYPHFGKFIGYLRTMCLLARLDNGVVELELPLLDGPPGTGKSTFAERLVGVIAGGYARVSMSAAESGALLGGSQETWSNSKPGLVFSTLVEGQYANPLILLDELDKVSTDSRFDPLGPAYQLLEPALARRFCDLSLPTLPIDASHVLWVATSNDASRIPEPIRQRLVQFDISLPTPEQSLAIVRSVMRLLQETYPRLLRFTLDEATVVALTGLAPREMRKRIRLACGQAAQAGRLVVFSSDLPADARQGRRMGF